MLGTEVGTQDLEQHREGPFPHAVYSLEGERENKADERRNKRTRAFQGAWKETARLKSFRGEGQTLAGDLRVS
jgi:hypothetical protein